MYLYQSNPELLGGLTPAQLINMSGRGNTVARDKALEQIDKVQSGAGQFSAHDIINQAHLSMKGRLAFVDEFGNRKERIAKLNHMDKAHKAAFNKSMQDKLRTLISNDSRVTKKQQRDIRLMLTPDAKRLVDVMDGSKDGGVSKRNKKSSFSSKAIHAAEGAAHFFEEGTSQILGGL